MEKSDLAIELAEYSCKEARQIYRAAKHLRRVVKLTEKQLTAEEEADETIKELEEEKK